MLGVGLHLINEFSEGEAASAPGDSGGPDFRIKLKSVDGKLAWLPEVVGVHSYGTGPKGHITVPGDRTASVQVTSELAALIRQLADITSQPIVYEEMIDLAPVSFRPPHTNGDQEFKGHGPNVNVSAQFFFRGDDLCLRIYMKARETVSDWTTAEGTLEYTMVRGFRRQFQIADGQTLSQAWNYTDNDEEDDASPVFSEGSVIGQFVCVGDTHGYDAGITTKVTVYFRPLRANRVVEA
jgi:hypothetical protein